MNLQQIHCKVNYSKSPEGMVLWYTRRIANSMLVFQQQQWLKMARTFNWYRIKVSIGKYIAEQK